MRRQRLKQADLVRLSGLSRPTITAAREGSKIGTESVRALARGLATDPYDGTFDGTVYADALRDLAEAAGYPHLLTEMPSADLESEIRAITKSPATAEMWAEFIRDNPDATPDQIRMMRALLKGIAQMGEQS